MTLQCTAVNAGDATTGGRGEDLPRSDPDPPASRAPSHRGTPVAAAGHGLCDPPVNIGMDLPAAEAAASASPVERLRSLDELPEMNDVGHFD